MCSADETGISNTTLGVCGHETNSHPLQLVSVLLSCTQPAATECHITCNIRQQVLGILCSI